MLRVEVLGNTALPGLRTELARFTESVMASFLTEAARITPVRSGRARRAWQQQGRRVNTQVVNTVPYIGLLDQGRSRQAPQGIVQPAINRTARRY